MNILEEFWYGKLDPAEYDANPSEEHKELVRLISKNEEKAQVTMIEEQKDSFGIRVASGNTRLWYYARCSRTASAWTAESC